MKRKLNENDVPEPVIHGFQSTGLDSRIVQSVAANGFTTPTLIQARTIPLALQKTSILARSKTGSGKTLAYALPVLHFVLEKNAQSSKSHTTTALILVPTNELAAQVTGVIKSLSHSSTPTTIVNLSKKEDDAVTRTRLHENPQIVVATAGKASHWINAGVLDLKDLRIVVVDEADLILSYGDEEDLDGIAQVLPAGVQTILMSATLRTEVDTLATTFCKSGAPTVIDLSSEEEAEKSELSQYIVRTAEEEKFLLIYAIFKLQLIKGKIIVFVADIDRCYRVKLFLEQFGIRSCIVNSELPVNSRLHAVEEFNKGVYDILIAADENEVVGDEGGSKKRRVEIDVEDEETVQAVDNGVEAGAGSEKKTKSKRNRKDPEFGVSRGIDFRRVACVLNFDLPTSSKSYTHRIGRTARAGQKGMALSFYVTKDLYRKHKSTTIPQCENDEKILERIKKKQNEKGSKLEEWQFDMDKLSGFRYRFGDALRAVTRIAIREARTGEIRRELINSAKLQRHFEEHPEDLRHLRHDTESHTIRHQAHLKHVPDYLLPAGGKAAMKQDVGFVGMRSTKENRLRKTRAYNKARGKGKIAGRKGLDPLRSLNARGRGKK